MSIELLSHTPPFAAGRVVNLADRPVPAFDAYIGRTFAGYRDSGFGNPLRLGEESPEARAHLLVRYWSWLNGPAVPAGRVRGRIRSGELTNRVLGCWCEGRGLCHGHVLAGLADGAVEDVRRWVEALAAALELLPAAGALP